MKKIPLDKIKITTEQLLFFNSQLASIVKLDLSIPAGLKSLAREVSEPKFKLLIQELEKEISQGISLVEAIKKFPNAFPPLYVEMLKAGESTGNLPAVLDELSRYSKTMHRVKNRLIDAITYPLFVMVVSFLLLMYMLVSVVPHFQNLLLTNRNLQLPAITQFLFQVSAFVRTPGVSFFGGMAFLLLLIVLGIKLRKALENNSQILFHIPILGTLFQKATLLKVCKTMADLLKSGVSMVETLALTANVCGKNRISQSLREMEEAVKRGERMSQKLQPEVFPETMIWKLQMAEERGILEDALEELAAQYENDLDSTASQIQRLVEPLMLLLIAVLIGSVVLSLYLPIFKSFSAPH
ncbi:MAG: type II secretion system F family protein [Planctomycetota bacterium]|nr:MAG: type II secretion system F family protein [Planctomycetota bacterium]